MAPRLREAQGREGAKAKNGPRPRTDQGPEGASVDEEGPEP